jgi:hypothetical protein
MSKRGANLLLFALGNQEFENSISGRLFEERNKDQLWNPDINSVAIALASISVSS